MMKFIPVLLVLFSFTLFSQTNDSKKLILKKIDNEIILDGIIDNSWNLADSTNDFFQLRPYYSAPPIYKTIAKILSTEENLYVLFICEQKYETIQQQTGKLDDFGKDGISIMLDTFNDKQTGYKLGVRASGARNDSRLLDDARNRDYNWDGIWFAETKIYDWGYIVEAKIPYKSIQFDQNLSEWGLDFDRYIPSIQEDLYWCNYEKNEGQRISKFGKLVFENFKPKSTGLNLEIYPVGIAKVNYLGNNKYDFDANAGLDLFYNPSPQLTYQLTVNPDFAQIEADPYDFNISRYETYFEEKRPFFTQGNEVFSPSGKERWGGSYQPLELFYPRRVGEKLKNGKEAPLVFGTKGFGRLNEWEYGAFLALSGSESYSYNNENYNVSEALFGAVRVKKNILGNSSIGGLLVTKKTKNDTYAVLDIDGALRSAEWQLSYQLARSFKNSDGDYAISLGFKQAGINWETTADGKYVGDNFEVNEIGYVPWRGYGLFNLHSGPVWYFKEGALESYKIFSGIKLNYEKEDNFTDYYLTSGIDLTFRQNWGINLNFGYGEARDRGKTYNSYNINLSSRISINPEWEINYNGSFSKSYNFRRDYLSFVNSNSVNFRWNVFKTIELGTSLNLWIEGNASNDIEDVTVISRPYFSITPVNDMNVRLYFENVYSRNSDKLESLVLGLLFAYNFSPKSWIYFAINEAHDRSAEFDTSIRRLHVVNRASALKIKYLYYL